MFGSFSGFGAAMPQPQQSPFGAPSTPGTPFGAPASPFGQQQSSTFGGTGGLFNAASQSAFGASPAPAPAFGAGTTPAFGATAPAFGASPAPTSNAFGATTNAFGAASTPAFGATSAPSFGAGAAPTFGSNTFGAGFGASAPAFGSSSSSPAFGGVSQAGFGLASTPSFGAASTPAFGAAGVSGFGAASAPAFGAASSAAFGASSTTPAFGAGGFGSLSSPGFGSTTSSFGAPAFGASAGSSLFSSSPAFGGSSNFPATGGFGATQGGAAQAGTRQVPFQKTQDKDQSGGTGAANQTTVAFNSISAMPQYISKSPEELRWEDYQAGVKQGGAAAATSAFGAPSSGLFNTQQAPSLSIGGAPTLTGSPAFGTAPSAFGTTSSPFGTGGFGTAQPSTPSLFGSTTSPFGQSTAASPSVFPSPSSSPAFAPAGTPASPGLPSFSFQSQPSAFPSAASSTASIFSSLTTAKPATPNMFGATTSTFPSLAPASTGLFNTSVTTQPSPLGFNSFAFPSTATPALGAFASQPANATQVALPTVTQAPYGSFPALPDVPESKVGISQRPVKTTVSIQKASPLLSHRSSAPKFGVQLKAREAPPTSMLSEAGSTTLSILPPRDNPRRLFIKEAPPSTESFMASILSPAKDSASITPERLTTGETPATDRRRTPEGLQTSTSPLFGDGVRTANGTALGVDSTRSSELPRLGHLESLGYYIEPPPAQLDAMLKDDMDSLKRVKNFTVCRKGVGMVRWLVPVDITRLRLDEIVQINQGEVSVYGGGSKPPMGVGLNVDAEITLYNVYKKDKQTGEIVKEGPKALKYEKWLRKVCSDSDAKFVSYKPDGGVWKFEVEHFSRYGLPVDQDDSDDDDIISEDDAVGIANWRQPRSQPATSNSNRELSPSLAGRSSDILEGEGDPSAASDACLDNSDTEGMIDDMQLVHFSQPAGSLQHTLPAQLRLDPTTLSAMKDTFFPRSQLQYESSLHSRGIAGTGAGGLQFQPTASDGMQKRTHNWRRPQPLRFGPKTSTPQLPIALSVVEFRLAVDSGAPSALDNLGAFACKADTGLCLGRSFRAGWGPNGVLVVPDNNFAGSRFSVKVTKLQMDSTANQAGLQVQQHCLDKLLHVHCKHSKPIDLEAELDLPQFTLQVSKDTVSTVAEEFVEACEEIITSAGTGSLEHVKELQHEVDSWELVKVLYKHIAGEETTQTAVNSALLPDDDGVMPDPPTSGPLAPATQRRQSSSTNEADEEAEMLDEDSPRTDAAGPAWLLAQFQRRAAVSQWLINQARTYIELALTGDPVLEPMHIVAQLLSGHQLGSAVAVATALGDVRLAMLVAAAGVHPSCKTDAAAQLSLWQRSGFLPAHIDTSRMLVYHILAGQVDQVQEQLSLDWRRFLGMYLWYVSPNNVAPSEPISLYVSQLLSPRASPIPHPVPHHVSQTNPGPARSWAASHLTDLHFELLQLWSGTSRLQSGWLGRLLRTSGHSSNPFEYRLVWMLLTVLSALRQVPLTGSDGTPQPEVLNTTLGFINQLQLVGGMSQWSVYVALHLPDHPLHPGWRRALVLQLLAQSCPEWCDNSSKVKFMVDVLGVPVELLASAKAVWASYNRDAKLACECLIASGDVVAGHARFVEEVAPQLLLSGSLAELRLLLETLAINSDGITSWALGAGLYQDYLRLFVDQHASQEHPDVSYVEECQHFASLVNAFSATLERSGVGLEGSEYVERYVQQKLVAAQMSQTVNQVLLSCAVMASSGCGRQQRVEAVMDGLGMLAVGKRAFTIGIGSVVDEVARSVLI